ncbi:actin cytoskeleton-regulatory complex protein PAN1-like [Andrographis paniculata]|uniref:actin cytoskeleton-regulatory complex protein PAN1-like n=1 Tax=Andrographis paniculata TaxID=175694 RepID=UPI0021E95BED|nr:actin cytoskeleton-regulatory complex protein PAN1-like [Andrographis paniculata]
MAATGGPSTEQFDAYFQRADLDRDGRISGAEAVAFFKGANLPQQVLAQIWAYADQNQSGFLSRPAFHNALKLVTVAQRKMQLTPEIVKGALYGPASAKIPPPQINFAVLPTPQPNSVAAAPSPQMRTSLPSSQAMGFRGQSPASMNTSQQFRPPISSPGMNQQFSQGQPLSSAGMNQQFGQLQTSSTGMYQQFRPVQSQGHQFGQIQPSSTSMNSNFGQIQTSSTNTHQHFGQVPLGANMNQQSIPSQGNQLVRPPYPGPAPRPPQADGGLIAPSGDSRLGSGPPNFKNDTSAATTAPVAQNPLDQLSSFSSAASQDPKVSVGSVQRSTSDSVFGGNMLSANQFQSQPESSAPLSSAKPDPFEVLQKTVAKPSTVVQVPQTSSFLGSNQQVQTQVKPQLSSSNSPSSVGSSIPEQSQTSWPKLTRASIQKYTKVFMEVDTDRDGKITGEQARNLFLSWRLPIEVLKQVWDLSDQDSDSMLSLREFCIALYLMEQYREGRSLPSSLPNSVMHDETLLSLAGPPVGYGSMGWGHTTGFRPPQQGLPGARPFSPAGLRPPVHPTGSHADGSMQFSQQNARSRDVGEDHSLDVKGHGAIETNEKVENNEKVLLDSREKLEFYRTKMQDLVLYKSRCENRLNEITERARADKTEAELLEKKYQEKYKQVAEIHTKLTIEEASFREVQERKMELRQALTRIEQGGSADGILQVRADRIQSDLEELLKALTNRLSKHSIEIKPSTLIELPLGWSPGIPEVAAIWDEEWDKFDDEGFSFDTAVPANGKPVSAQRDLSSPSLSPEAVSDADTSSDKPFSTVSGALETESMYSADENKSPQGSPHKETTSEEYSGKHFRKSSDEDAETNRSFDESAWGNFDNNNDDIDSVWGFNAKESNIAKGEEKYFFNSTDFGASPSRTDSPDAGNTFNKNSQFIFADSVPATPQSRAANSPPSYTFEPRDPFSDSFSRYDSFSARGRSSSPPRGSHARFDSISSTAGFERGRSSSPPHGSHARFDSITSTTAFDQSRKFSFDDSDPFGSGPFKVTTSETPKKGSEWSSF